MTGVIYQYTINGKHYVGKTYGLERKRIDKHKYEALTLQKDHPFCRAIRKYGWDVARKSYQVLETVEAEDKQTLNRLLIDREAYWIKRKNSIVPNGYNIYTKGQEQIPHTQGKEEIYQRVSNSLKGKHRNHPATSRPVYCVEEKKWYPSVSEAERGHQLSKGTIGKAAIGKNLHAGNLTWNFSGKDEPAREDLLRKQCKAVICVDNSMEFSSIYEAAKWLWGKQAYKKKCGLQAALKRGGTVCGYTFRFKDK